MQDKIVFNSFLPNKNANRTSSTKCQSFTMPNHAIAISKFQDCAWDTFSAYTIPWQLVTVLSHVIPTKLEIRSTL